MTENEQINVLIKDGNRTVNWDYHPNKTVGAILEETEFRPLPGTVGVKGLDMFGPQIGGLRLAECPQEIAPDGKQMRVVITLRSKPEKTLKERKKEGSSADVR